MIDDRTYIYIYHIMAQNVVQYMYDHLLHISQFDLLRGTQVTLIKILQTKLI